MVNFKYRGQKPFGLVGVVTKLSHKMEALHKKQKKARGSSI